MILHTMYGQEAWEAALAEVNWHPFGWVQVKPSPVFGYELALVWYADRPYRESTYLNMRLDEPRSGDDLVPYLEVAAVEAREQLTRYFAQNERKEEGGHRDEWWLRTVLSKDVHEGIMQEHDVDRVLYEYYQLSPAQQEVFVVLCTERGLPDAGRLGRVRYRSAFEGARRLA